MKKIKTSCIENIYNIDTDNKKIIVDILSSCIQEAELAYKNADNDISFLSNRKHKSMKRITNDLFVTIDNIKL